MRAVWAAFWGELNTPESFPDDPYKGGLNQLGHVVIGAATCSVLCLAYAAVYGEMPYKWAVWVGLSLGYLVGVEWLKQGWSGADSVVDAAFVAAGVALPLVALSEMSLRPVLLAPNPIAGIGSFVAVMLALAAYVFPRAKRKYRV